MGDFVLLGRHLRLEPLGMEHVDGLVRASAGGEELYRWSAVPIGLEATRKYVQTALEWKAAGTAVPFAVVRLSDGTVIPPQREDSLGTPVIPPQRAGSPGTPVIGSTRFFDIERWAWPEGHARFGRTAPDVCEIGYTWYSPDVIRTAVNTEAKTLLLTYAFEEWGVLRVCLHTDARNERSRAAMERIGCRFEGILRAHRMAVDATARDSARYSIVAGEWLGVKARLVELAARPV